jgi:hypothetical protein
MIIDVATMTPNVPGEIEVAKEASKKFKIIPHLVHIHLNHKTAAGSSHTLGSTGVLVFRHRMQSVQSSSIVCIQL